MPIVGMTIKNIEARKTGELVQASLKVNNNTNIKEVSEKDLPALGKNKKGLSIGFEYKADYLDDKKSIGEIVVNGDVFFLDEEQDKILKQWKKEKKLPDDVNIQVLNAILRRCLTRALSLSEDVQLPPPIAMPFATKTSPDQSRYIG